MSNIFDSCGVVGRGNVTILKIIATSLYMEVLKNVDVSCVFGHNN